MKQASNHLIITLAAGLLFGLAADAFAQRPFTRTGFRPGGAIGKVEADEVSITINRSQWLMDELHRFAVAGSVLSSGKADSLRRKLDTLERHEDAAKQDNSLSEGEREKLLKETREIWRWCADAFS